MSVALTERDRYAADVSHILATQGLLSDEEELKRYLRGW